MLLLEDRKCITGIIGLDDVEPVIMQNLNHIEADEHFIFYYNDDFRAFGHLT